MSKYVPDILSKRWVIVSPQRVGRPNDVFGSKKKNLCPLCEGHESMTPDEILRYGKGSPNKPGWQVRVFPNKYPISDYHEVITHSPNHNKDIEELPEEHIQLILKAYVERYNFYKKKGQVLIFCNQGEHAGASLDHSHSQLVVIPFQINLDTLAREPLNNVVDQNSNFNVYCPDFSQWPYEVWITPKTEATVFGDITNEKLIDLACLLKKTLHELKVIYQKNHFDHVPFGYNYYIYHKENWYLRIIPRFVHRAGFELGTGLSVNIVDPIEAATALRGEDQKMTKVLHKLKKFA